MKHLFIYLSIIATSLYAQKDFSSQWKDLFSYNDVKDFTIVGNKLYAVSTNAMFVYSINDKTSTKFSSVNGLSGANTASISFDEISENIIIGYQNGLVEVVSEKGNVTPITGIRDNLILVNKAVKGFYRNDDNAYVFGDFGISELDTKANDIKESYQLTVDSSDSNKVYQLVMLNNLLYAATEKGLYSFDVLDDTLNPRVFNDWIAITVGEVKNLMVINNQIFFSKQTDVFEVSNPSNNLISTTKNIEHLAYNTDERIFVVTMPEQVVLYEAKPTGFTLSDQIDISSSTTHDFKTNKAILLADRVYMNSEQFGVLSVLLTKKQEYTEIHPNGPFSNDAFAITVSGNQKWIVYGGFDKNGYNGLIKPNKIDVFDGTLWKHIPSSQLGSYSRDFTKVVVDPFDNTKALVGSYFNGVLEFNDFEYVTRWTKTNTMDIIPGHNETSNASVNWIADAIVDKNNMVWIGSSRAEDNRIFTLYDGSQSGLDRWVENVKFPPLLNNGGVNKGLNRMFVDKDNNIFAGTRSNGLLVFNANPVSDPSERKTTVLNNSANNGQLPSNEVLCVASDENNKIWIGTDLGLVVFDDYDNLYKPTKRPASKVVINENGVAREFLSSTQVNDIVIDQAGNKWFATQEAGVIHTSSNGQTTYNIFNSSNSPLPKNTVIDLEMDTQTGFLYMVTDKGVVAYDTNLEPFGATVTSVVAYPNPAVSNKPGHENITIVAKDGNGIPDGTNVKIMDVSGKLVYETSVSNLNQSGGGKVVWDKTNLSGRPVVSGVYIVLLSSSDSSQTTITKIAIVN